ncbi:MAG: hypothetical protein Q8L68_03765 [Methylococcales bacterium]|nr:hypothetical protein [Methylococcales bacterium]
MLEQEPKQTSTERVKAHQARKKERKQYLASKGFIEVPLIVKVDQVFKIENAAKMTGKSASELLFLATQSAVRKLCEKHDEILNNKARYQMEKVFTFIDENPELIERLIKEQDEGIAQNNNTIIKE